MAIRRRLFASTPGYSVSAKQRSYGMPTRTLPTYPRYSRSGHYGDTRSEDTLLFDRVSQVSYLSDALLDEGYDTARRSRGRDQQLLREATNAIVSSESYATPQTSVASRRVARGRVIRAASVPPRSAPPAYSEAAIIASKLEPDPIKRRRPRSQFAADKLRNMRKEAQESVYTGTASAGMTASTPPLPRLTERKAIRTEEGFSKPKNILSWQYRVESRIPPNDLLYQPSSFIRIREQVRNAQERMDRHRQLLDRYLPDSEDTGDIAAKVLRKTSELEKRNASYRAGGGADSTTATVKNPALYATGVEQRTSPVSELRRRIRKTLNKSRMSYS
ncbi:uncharacterized protein LOC112576527 isoform X10 [Pomacea canaliculata]|uniref:uncharacterized protein LOC112576527 isoform X10 n=1 Tax=Pomacea canaliculata TaxID=400727 RepID=UPI000D73136A|nr:uncharacterized protein LOC112576527 isoform X10 [Pomacea canaliculata]